MRIGLGYIGLGYMTIFTIYVCKIWSSDGKNNDFFSVYHSVVNSVGSRFVNFFFYFQKQKTKKKQKKTKRKRLQRTEKTDLS
jgi:hypothetical protein